MKQLQLNKENIGQLPTSLCGIYKITNVINNHCYIGQSIDIKSRLNQHLAMRYEATIYRAFKKYGLENFVFEIIELCLKEKLNEREIYWIAKYDSHNNGYNMTDGGEGGPASGHRRAVAQYDQEGNFIAEYESITAAEKALGVKNSNITRVCKGQAYEAIGFQWRYIINASIDYTQNIGKSPLKKRLASSARRMKKVAQCDKETHKIIKIFNSIKEAAKETNIYFKSIYKTINGECQSAGGYYWIEYKNN